MKHGRTAIRLPVAGWNAWDGRAERGTHRGRGLELIDRCPAAVAVAARTHSPGLGFRLHPRRGAVRMVFASRHGELARSADLLKAIARDEDLSPTVFGLSVLNATAGLYAMACQDLAKQPRSPPAPKRSPSASSTPGRVPASNPAHRCSTSTPMPRFR